MNVEAWQIDEASTCLANEAMSAGDGTSQCPMCGKTYVHRHSGEDFVIYRNGIKRALRVQADNENVETRTVDKHGVTVWGVRGKELSASEADRHFPHRAPHRIETRRVGEWLAQHDKETTT